MPHLTHANTITGGSLSIGRTVTRTGDSLKTWKVSLPKGEAGTLSTRTSATVGELTLAASHGITTAATVDLYWSGGRRYGVTVGTVAGAAVPISGGSGDDLPAATTAIAATEQVVATVNIDGDAIQLLGIGHELPDADTSKAHAQMLDSGAAEIAEVDLNPNQGQAFDIAGGDTNPFTGNPIVSLAASNGSADNDGVLTILSLEDATP